VKEVVSNLSIQTQIQQLQQLIREKVDLIIVFPQSSKAEEKVLNEAGEAGIPIIVPLNPSESKYTVGLNGNETLRSAELTAGVASIMGEKGEMMVMQGIPGVGSNESFLEGVEDIVKACPEIKIAAKPAGEYNPATAKTATLQFLASHPQPVDGVVQINGMAASIIQAFQQTGREVPPIGDNGATPGALAYWKENEGSYEGIAAGLPVKEFVDAIWNVSEGLLEGRGLKVSEINQAPLLVTDENLDEWVEPDWTLETPQVYAPGPPGVFYPPSYLEQFFTNAKK
jgi:ribose transport system substrate-binding protein